MSLINNKFELDYIPARVCEGKELTIKYYYWDVNEQKRKRKVMRFNSLLGKFPKREVLKLMHQACAEINTKLQSGKNPSIESEMPKAYKRLTEAMEIFSQIKNNEMRSDSIRSYKSYIKRLYTFMEKMKIEKCYVINFTKDHAVELMTELELDKNISNRTWNNYMVFYRSLWNWLIEKNYCKINVFGGYKKKHENQKMRSIIDPVTHEKIIKYCRSKIPNFEIVIDLVRASFIRPAEICRIQIENIDLKNGVISIPGGKSKTKNFRYAYLPDWLVDKISNRFNLGKYPGSYYFISSNHKKRTTGVANPVVL